MKSDSFKKNRKIELIFYICLIAIPLLQFFLMYILVNIGSILLIFQRYDADLNRFVFDIQSFLYNVKSMASDFVSAPLMLTSWKNSITFYLINLLFVMPLSIIISFFVYKKLFMAGYFGVVLYLPCIITSMATVVGFKYFAELGLAKIFPESEIFNNNFGGVISNPSTSFGALTFYSIWSSLGGSLVLMTGVMSRTDRQLIESAKIDGVNLFQEFFHIVWPVIYPVVTIMLYTGVTGIFTGGPPLYDFFGNKVDPNSYTFGYYFFTLIVGQSSSNSLANYPRAATGGIMFTIVAVPLVLFLKSFFERHDPNEEKTVGRKRV